MENEGWPSSEPEIEPEIAADDVGASAAAERLQKQIDAVHAGSDAVDPLRKDGRRDENPKTDADDELLIDGQEEVFSRSEIETGRIEHHVGEEAVSQPGVEKDDD